MITTDVITGFPGETEEEFQETLTVIEKANFLKVHAFPYSRRSGTVADKMPHQIAPNIKDERCQRVIALSQKTEAKILEQAVGKPLMVLAEQRKEKGFYGLSENYLPVMIQTEREISNRICKVIPHKTDGTFLYAKLEK